MTRGPGQGPGPTLLVLLAETIILVLGLLVIYYLSIVLWAAS